jgi:2-amino-4-hydroxy-6-hydroxymethyldihydropteridine diphosphokinase
MTERVFIALGSNLDDRLSYLQSGLDDLQKVPGLVIERVSRVYETAPQGYTEQPVFLNAVCCGWTEQSPSELLAAIQEIEHRHGRQRIVHWGPRTLDLDLLLFGAVCSPEPALTLPHPYIGERDFVLVPLVEIAPEIRNPITQQPYADDLKRLNSCELPAVAQLRL